MDQTQLATTIVENDREIIRWQPAPERPLKEKAIIAGILVALALVSVLVAIGVASSPETYGGVYQTLEEKSGNVLGMVATTTGASAAISLLPGDAGTPIANKLVDLSSYLMVILAVIYLEKFLLTTLGGLAFGILVPAACLLLAGAVFARSGTLTKLNLQKLGAKLAAFGLALFLVVPVSVWITDNVDASHEEAMAQAAAATQQATEQLEANAQEEPQEDAGVLGNIANAVQSGIEDVTQGAQNALDSLRTELDTMIDNVAVMIVTSCLVPLLVLVVFLQLAKIITGLDFGGATAVMGIASTKGRAVASATKKAATRTNNPRQP